MEGTVDTLKIVIQGESATGVEALKNATSALTDFETAINKLDVTPLKGLKSSLSSLSQITTNISTLTQSLSGLSSIDVSGVAQSVSSLVTSLTGIDTASITALGQLANSLSSVASIANIDWSAIGTGVTSLVMSLAQISESNIRKLERLGDALSRISKIKGLSAISGKIKEIGAVKGLSATAKGIRRVGNESKRATGKLGGFFESLKRIALYRFVRFVLKEISDAMKEGIGNLYQYDKAFGGDFAKAMDSLATSFLYLKNSLGAMVAPIITSLVPTLSSILDIIAEIANGIGYLFAALSGATTFKRAVRVQTEYAEAIDDTTEANERLKKSLLGIDEINALQAPTQTGGGTTAPSPLIMFEDVPIGDQLSLGKFFKAFKEAWEKDGEKTIKSIKRAFSSLKKLFKSIGKSFGEAFDSGSGKETLEAIQSISSNIAETVANIAEQFRKAWEENDTGTQIIESIWDILNSVLETVDNITASTAEWAKNLDFAPLLQSVLDLLEQIEPIIEFLGLVISDLWDNIVLPVMTWFVESGIPDVINALVGLLEFLRGVFTGDWEYAWQGIVDFATSIWELLWVDTLYPIIMWFYEEVLVPIGDFFVELWEDIKELGIGAWEGIKSVWETVATWFDESIIQPVCEFFKGLWESVSGFFVDLWEDIKDVWETVATWFDDNVIQPIVGFFEGLWEDVSGIFVDLWEDIKGVWETVATWFDEHVIQPIVGFFEDMWEGLKGIINGILAGVETVVNGFVAAINWIVDGLNAISFDVPDWVPGIGGKSIGFNIKHVAEVSLPRLEKGGLVNAGQLFIANEAGPELVGQYGNKSAVMNNEQIVRSVSDGVYAANAEQTALIREQNNLLREMVGLLASGENSGTDLLSAVQRMNRRAGKTLIPLGI